MDEGSGSTGNSEDTLLTKDPFCKENYHQGLLAHHMSDHQSPTQGLQEHVRLHELDLKLTRTAFVRDSWVIGLSSHKAQLVGICIFKYNMNCINGEMKSQYSFGRCVGQGTHIDKPLALTTNCLIHPSEASRSRNQGHPRPVQPHSTN